MAGKHGHYHKSSDCFEYSKKSSLLKSSHPNKYLPNFPTQNNLAREQALPWLPVNWQEKEGELATVSLEFEFHLHSPVVPRRLSCQISANQHKAETSLKVKNHRKTCARAMTSLLMSSPPISISHQLFWCRY